MQAILSYKEDLFSGQTLNGASVTIDVCYEFWNAMPEVAEFLHDQTTKYIRKMDSRSARPYTVKITPDWVRHSVKIKVTGFRMDCEFAGRLLEFIRSKAGGKY